jgi:hypothetical protein
LISLRRSSFAAFVADPFAQPKHHGGGVARARLHEPGELVNSKIGVEVGVDVSREQSSLPRREPASLIVAHCVVLLA